MIPSASLARHAFPTRRSSDLTVSTPALGGLSTGTSGAVTSTYNAGTGVWTASGAIADVNKLLTSEVQTPAEIVNGSLMKETSVSYGTLSVRGSKDVARISVID